MEARTPHLEVKAGAKVMANLVKDRARSSSLSSGTGRT